MAAKGDLGLVARYLGRYRRDFALATVFAFAEAVLELTIPFQMAYIVDVGIAQAKLDLIYLSGAQMLVTALVAGGCGLGYARASARAAMGFGANLREAEYAHLQGFAFSNLDEFETSSLVTRMTTDVTIVQNALMMGFRPLLRGPIMLVMGLLIACTMSVQLALVFLVTLPVLAVILAIIVSRVAPLYGVMQGAMDRLNEALQEDLVAIRAIKAYVREDYVAERFERVNELLAKSSTRTFRIAVLNTPIFQLSMGVASVCLLWFGGQMIMAGVLGVGTLTGFMSYVLLIMNSLMMISSVFLLLARAITSIHRICEVLRERPALTSAKDGLTSVSDGGVRFCDVSFKYSANARKDVLEHVSLRFAPGSTVGILGGTGSGKTSLVQLIARLYDASTGVVEVGGHDVRDYDLASLREAVGIVLQKNVLFSGTVRDNLRWGNPDATDEELLEACRVACADEFLERIGGLDGDLGQGGVNVSGGQKQRLCIARTLLKHPKVIVFDDSTSAVDMKTDAMIRSSLVALGGMTKVIVAQRVSSVVESDQIVILDDGRVHATGTHAELLMHDHIYQELCASQGVASLHEAVGAAQSALNADAQAVRPGDGGEDGAEVRHGS